MDATRRDGRRRKIATGMKATYEWLKELCPALGSVEEAARLFEGVGLEVASISPDRGTDAVIDLEVPSNRSDLLGVIGLAREIAAAKGQPLTLPPTESLRTATELPSLTVRLEEPIACPRYTALEATVAEGAQTPEWMKHRLEALGLRSIHPMVDLTNYVMLESGQPMHAFDAQRLKERTLVIRRARSGEPFKTLDGRTLSLSEDDLLIADAMRGVALAGVIGGEDSGIQMFSREVIFESAWFHRAWIRATAKRHQIRTESSLRFEREVNPEGVLWAQRRIAYLLKAERLGEAAGVVIDLYPNRDPERLVKYEPKRFAKLIGLEIPAEDQDEILSALGFEKTSADGGATVYRVPSHRRDVSEEADLIEEVARHIGYDRVPGTISAMPAATGEVDMSQRLEDGLAEMLAGWGFQEMVTLPLRSGANLDIDPLSGQNGVAVQNALSEDLSVLRPSLAPGLVDAISLNARRGAPLQPVFEIGAVFRSGSEGVIEERRACLLLPAETDLPDWEQNTKSRKGSFFRLKGFVEAMMERMGVSANWSTYNPGGKMIISRRSLALEDENHRAIGWVGEVSPAYLSERGIRGQVFVAEVLLNEAIAKQTPPVFQELPLYPALTRDISMLVSGGTRYEDIESTIREAGGENLREIVLFDRYSGADMGPGDASIAVQLRFQRNDRTLTGKEIDEAVERVIRSLESLGVRVRK